MNSFIMRTFARKNNRIIEPKPSGLGSTADPRVYEVTQQATYGSHKPCGRQVAIIFSHRASLSFGQYKLYCLVTEAHVCEQPVQRHYMKEVKPATSVQCPDHYTTTSHSNICIILSFYL